MARDPELALLEESCDLQSFYGSRTEKLLIRDAGKRDFKCQMLQAEERKTRHSKETKHLKPQSLCDNTAHHIADGIQNSSCFNRTQKAVLDGLDEFGAERTVTRSTLDDEYERELEQEEEEEYERELPPREHVAKCTSWDFKALIETRDCSKHYQGTIFDVLRETEEHKHFRSCSAMPEMFNGLADVRVTDDFRVVLRKQSRTRSSRIAFRGMGRFLRPVNSFFVVTAQSRSCSVIAVCLTDREAGQILDLIYLHGRKFHAQSPELTKNSVILVTHLACGANISQTMSSRNSCALMAVNVAGEQPSEDVLKQKLSSKLITALQLFNGESQFPSVDGRQVVHNLFKGKDMNQRSNLARGLMKIRNMRGRQHDFERSNLDDIQKEFGVELHD